MPTKVDSRSMWGVLKNVFAMCSLIFLSFEEKVLSLRHYSHGALDDCGERFSKIKMAAQRHTRRHECFYESARSRAMPIELFLSWVETSKTFAYTIAKKSVRTNEIFNKTLSTVGSRFRFLSFKLVLSLTFIPERTRKLFIRRSYALHHSESIEKDTNHRQTFLRGHFEHS